MAGLAAKVEAMIWATGDTLAGRLRLKEKLGQGGVGEVWSAHDATTGHEVATKIIALGAAEDRVRMRADLEAEASRSLEHPHVVRVTELLAVDDQHLVIVMERLHGETLAERLDRQGPLSVGDAAAVLRPVVSALGAAHEAGVVHRDLKPSNVFLSHDGDVKVLDFGIAKRLGPGTTSVTQTGAVVGTPAYMAPEQSRTRVTVDHRADVWALGVVLYEALAGGRPIEGRSAGEVLMRLLEDGITPLAVVAPDVPAPVSALVDRMLQRDLNTRVADLREVQEVLSPYDDREVPAFGPPAHAEP